MAVRASLQKALALGNEHGAFIFGCFAAVASVVGGAISATSRYQALKKDLEHERELRKDLQKRTVVDLQHERELREDLQKRTVVDLQHERELRKELQQRVDLLVKNQLFDILHHADYEAAAGSLHRSEASPAAHPSTD